MGFLVFAAALGPGHLRAQGSVTVSVRVVDSAAAAIAGTDISIVRNVATAVAHGTTSSVGRTTLTVPRMPGELQLIARRIGFQAGYRFFALPSSSDSLTLELLLIRMPQQLAPVRVTAAEDLRRKSYHLDAEDIENSSRAMIDGTDLFKLRPDMMNSRGGPQACLVPWTDHDGWIENVWVNGQRVVLPIIDSVYVAGRKAALGLGSMPPRPNPRITPLPKRATPLPPPWTQFRHIDTALAILQSIKAEHIAEVTYNDCFAHVDDRVHSDMSMFIVLKPGIGYDHKRGSYVIAGDTTERRGPGFALDSLARHRFRLLGVYDITSGDPIPGLDVIDIESGLRARTTATGTVSLFFLPEGTRAVRLHHDAYRDTTIAVTISPRDTLPLTFILSRKP